jgi:hypothetical protein
VQVGIGFVIFEHALGGQILCDDLDLLLASARLAQVTEGDLVNGEETDGGSVFRSHVADGGSVCKGETFHARSIELNEFINDSFLSEHFGAE